ncbi:hypothetical protein AB0I72_08885, partial [Nocardiopsis sp. NPDC049922]
VGVGLCMVLLGWGYVRVGDGSDTLQTPRVAKAALNMLTRTSAQELLETDGILMTSVDTGWITDERPYPDKERIAAAGFHAPLDLEDGAARVYDPIVRGERGEDVYGCFLKDYAPAAW